MNDWDDEPDLESGEWVYDEMTDEYVHMPDGDPETNYGILNAFNYPEYWGDDE